MNTREPRRPTGPALHSTTDPFAPGSRRGTIVVAFADPPGVSTIARVRGEVEIISDAPPDGPSPWRPLAPLRHSVPVDVTMDLLERLNGLIAKEGTPYSDLVREGETRPWWFHQQIAFDHYLEPFLVYRPLLEACASAERVLVLDPPDDLASLLPLLPFETISAVHTCEISTRVTPLDDDNARNAAAPLISVDERAPSVEKDGRLRTTGGGRMRRAAAQVRGLAATLYFGLMTSAGIGISLAKRRDLIVYGVDVSDDAGRNPWLSGLYDAMVRQGCRFDELVWSRSGLHAVRQTARRRRPVIHLQAIVPRPPAAPSRSGTSCSAADDLTTAFLHALAERVLVPRASWSVRAVHRIERLLDILRPAGVLVMDDPVHSFEVLAACRRRGIPTVAVQHGQIGHHTAGLIAPGYAGPPLFADRYCVWSDRFRGFLASESSLVAADSIRVCGLPRAADAAPPTWSMTERNGEAGENGGGDSLRVLFLAEQFDSHALEREVAPYLRALWQSFPEMRIRPHPVRRTAGELLRLLTTEELPIRAGTRGQRGPDERGHRTLPAIAPDSLGLELARTDVVVGSFSSALFEAIHALVPVVLFATPRHNDPHDLAAEGLAALAASPAAIAPLVRAAARLSRRERLRRRNELWGPQSRDGGQAALAELADIGGKCQSRDRKLRTED